MNIIFKVIEKKYDISARIMIQLLFAALTFYMAYFHKTRAEKFSPQSSTGRHSFQSLETQPEEEQINKFIETIYEVIKHGLGFSQEKIISINFDNLEKLVESKMTSDQYQPEPLFKAVAEAVAEAGPWEASMELVAKKMGLSKSSLYGHFKNKKDMLHRLFITEFKRIIDFARLGISLSSDTAQQLYLGIYSIAVYLKTRPEILISIDWIRTRKIDFGKPEKHKEIFRPFEDIKIDEMQSHWILFLLVNVLTKTDETNQDMMNVRVLYRFITLGLGGFER